MKNTFPIALFSAAILLKGCYSIEPAAEAEDPTTFNYTEANLSGLSPLRPYPSAGDVCELLRDSKRTEMLKLEGQVLIACPKHEKGAIADRQAEGARVVGNAKHWVVLSVKK